jgi:hypothetical protein
MDLGLSQLSDDQLVNLLDEAVVELLSRDNTVQKVAQQGILGIAEKQKAFMELARNAVADAERIYIESIRQDVRAEVMKAVASGEINIGKNVGSDTEARVIVEVTKEQIAAIKADLARDPDKSSFQITYNGRTRELVANYHSAGQNWDAKRNLTMAPNLMESVRRAVLGAFGIPTE